MYDGVYHKVQLASPLRKRLFEKAMHIARDRNHRLEYGLPVSPWLSFMHSVADALVMSKIRAKLMGGQVQWMGSGGAAGNLKMLQFFEDIGLPITEGYGLTETSPVVTCSATNWKYRRLGCAGVPLSCCQVIIRDVNTNEEVPLGEEDVQQGRRDRILMGRGGFVLVSKPFGTTKYIILLREGRCNYLFQMTQRGRGLLEISASKNPFFQTTNAEIGAKPADRNIDWTRPQVNRVTFEEKKPSPEENGNFSFLYTRTSDVIGGRLEASQRGGKMAQAMAPIPSWKKPKSTMSSIKFEEEAPVQTPDAATVLQHFHHVSKEEDPRFTTSANEYGKKAPTIATFVASRESRPQGFSRSFNGVKPNNSSLNTSLTKSTIHPKLDPQFV